MHLAIHGDWQEKARREVVDIFGNQNPHLEGIAKLKIMTMIINETLRLYGPTSVLQRTGTREIQLGKLLLPANIDILPLNIGLHRDPHFWGNDVHHFKPERFAEGIAKATNYTAAAFFPFGLGPRSCVGMTFAMIETKIALSMILQRYTITLSPAYVHSPILILTFQPQNGIQSEKLENGIQDSVMEMIKKREDKVVSGEADSFGNDFLGLLVNAYHDLDDKNRVSLED
ncbi:hypothetical protein Gogos_011311, partial [Gossypium gossypioides]|nr:hypothetical protein [Gossypium gossypioides]